MGIPRRQRLLRTRDYSRVFRRGRRTAVDGLAAVARPNELGYPRLGLAVSRRHARKATVRNRTKRVIRESFRAHQHLLNSLDVVVVTRQGVAAMGKPDLRANVDELYRRLSKQCERWSST